MFQLAERFGFDLADAFAGDGELLADFFERVVGVHADAKAHAQDAFFAGRERSEHAGGGFAQVGVDRRIDRQHRVAVLDEVAKEPISLETPIGDEEDSHLGDFIEDRNAVLPIDAAINANLRETTTRVLASLTPREERVLRMRFGIGMNTDHTLEEVGQQFSVTRERIRQIEAKALRKLKHPSRSRKLRSFLDN